MNKLCKASEKINQSELYDHFTKLLDQSTTDMDADADMKNAHKLTAKTDKTIKTRRGRKWGRGEEEEDE